MPPSDVIATGCRGRESPVSWPLWLDKNGNLAGPFNSIGRLQVDLVGQKAPPTQLTREAAQLSVPLAQ